ncbi:hypothetical protein [Gaiella sp.]|uniref:hypothetical protein n=1 Tax=Gaiella sp. TaxID=2663207 RepID=UPI003266AEB0
MARERREERPLPAHPFRDTAIVYGVMAVILVVLAGVTGGSLLRAIGAAIIFWLVATAWSWWKFRKRIRERDLAEAAAAADPAVKVDPGASSSEGAANPGRAVEHGAANGNANGSGRGAGSGTDS